MASGQGKKRSKGATRNPKIPRDPKTPKLTGGTLSRKRGQLQIHKNGKGKVGGPATRGPMAALEKSSRNRKSKLTWPD